MDWHAIALLGAFHGINPGMGWLFAVALGLQQGSARGVWRALPPIAAGHALSIGAVLAGASLVRSVVPDGVLTLVVSALLTSMGLFRLWRHRHPRFGGMQVGVRDLVVWSFLMATAHGAGLMLLPFHCRNLASATNAPALDAIAAAVHTAAYLVVMTATAWVVYRRLGLSLLRTAWFDMDRVWAVALVVTGLVVLWK